MVNTPADSVAHYGEAATLNIIVVKSASYHEKGKIGFAEIQKGRIALEAKYEVSHIYINSNIHNVFDPIIIKDNNGAQSLPQTITHDEITVENITRVFVVESNAGTQEEVYVYLSGTAGSTEKVTEGENKQNEKVNSILGRLVLDNRTENKVLSADEKQSFKEEVATDAVSAELESLEGNSN